MVKTGYISFIEESGGGQDANGNPIPSADSLTPYIECNLKTITSEYKVYSEGQYLQASYSCIIDQNRVYNLGIDIESIRKVSLQDNEGNIIGIFQLHNLEYLNLTKRIKLVV